MSKPFSTYPESREKLISLATVLQRPHDVETGEKAADELSDLVLAILSDEATDEFDRELDDAELAMIDTAWEKHKAAGPVAKVINDNQPGNTAIVEIMRNPPTLAVGTVLFTGGSDTLPLTPSPVEGEKTAKLKSCPFCGGEATIKKMLYGRPVLKWVACSTCEASATAFSKAEDAEAAWNCRAEGRAARKDGA